MPADMPGIRPRSVGNDKRENSTDNPHQAWDPILADGSWWGGRFSSFVVRKPRLVTGALYLAAGGLRTLLTPLQFSVSVLCKVRLLKGCSEDRWRWIYPCFLCAFSLVCTLNTEMGKGFLISANPLSCFSHSIVRIC